MAEPNALCEPIATTSLYEEEGSDRSTALTLEEAAAEYVQLRPPTASDTHAYRETAPFLVVQLRKRRGKVEVLLDGHLSEGEKETRDGETVRVHKIYWHNGLHEDAEARTRALSPLPSRARWRTGSARSARSRRACGRATSASRQPRRGSSLPRPTCRRTA